VGTDPATLEAALSKLGTFGINQLVPPPNASWITVTKQGNTVTVTCTGVYTKDAQSVWQLTTPCGLSRGFQSTNLDPYNPICEHIGFSFAPLGVNYPGNPSGSPGHGLLGKP